LATPEQEEIARRIPSIGGAKLAPILRAHARSAPSGTAIVEVGAWMGAGTAQLALGVLDRDSHDGVSLHAFDRWHASNGERRKADTGGVAVAVGEDLLPIVKRTLQPLGVPIQYRQGEIRDVTWDGPDISVYVDDAAKQPAEFLHVLRAFAPAWQAGSTTLVLMDFGYWRKAPWGRRWFYRIQDIIIHAHPSCFRRWTDSEWDARKTSAAVFDYLAPIDTAEVERMWRVRFLVAAHRLLYEPLSRVGGALRVAVAWKGRTR
jgi:hypothetical protein